jgi:hypothetical protein
MDVSKLKNLPRIHDVLRVERTLDGTHHVDGTDSCPYSETVRGLQADCPQRRRNEFALSD